MGERHEAKLGMAGLALTSTSSLQHHTLASAPAHITLPAEPHHGERRTTADVRGEGANTAIQLAL